MSRTACLDTVCASRHAFHSRLLSPADGTAFATDWGRAYISPSYATTHPFLTAPARPLAPHSITYGTYFPVPHTADL